MELTILLPCLNEELTIENCIQSAQRFICEEKLNAEILIADNGSTDNSATLAKDLGARIVHVDIKGYGAAISQGTLNAKGRYVIVADSDASYDLYDLKPILNKLRDGVELVIGNRFLGGISPGAMPWKNRYIGNPILSWLGRRFFPSNIGDFHCGLRGYSLVAFKKFNLKSTGMEFASEMIIKATLLSCKVEEVPVKLYPDGRARKPHLRPWRDGFRHLSYMLIYSPDWFFLYPGLLFFIIGLFLTLLLSVGEITLFSGVVLDIHTLLYSACLLLLGFQLIIFSTISKTIAQLGGLRLKSKLNLRIFSLEIIFIAGITFLICGLLGSTVALYKWEEVNFGALNIGTMLRLVIPSVTMMLLGAQIIFLSLFMAFLKFMIR